LQNPDAAILGSLWRAFPTPYEIDLEDEQAATEMLRTVVLAAFSEPMG
jgi:hypothetical protein